MVDKTEPQNRLILFFTLIAVGTLVCLEPVFRSYFDYSSALAEQQSTSAPRQLHALRAKEEQLLEGGVPIAQTIQSFVEREGKGRGWRSRIEWKAVTPRASVDQDPLIGWSEFKRSAKDVVKFRAAQPVQPAEAVAPLSAEVKSGVKPVETQATEKVIKKAPLQQAEPSTQTKQDNPQ